MHTSWGSNPIGFLNISCLHLIFDPDDVSLWKTNISRLDTLCHHEKCRGFGLFLDGIFFNWYFLQLICSSFGILISLVSFQSGIFTHVLIWVFDIIWTLCFLVALVCALLLYLVFCLNYILFGSWKSCACIFIICISFGMLTFVDPIYRINSIKS